MSQKLGTTDAAAAYDTLLVIADLTSSPGDAYDIGMAGIVRRALDRAPDASTRARVDAARVTLAADPRWAYLRDWRV